MGPGIVIGPLPLPGGMLASVMFLIGRSIVRRDHLTRAFDRGLPGCIRP
jgi:hypothetical protein